MENNSIAKIATEMGYCYLCLIDDDAVYNKKMQYYKAQTIKYCDLLRYDLTWAEVSELSGINQ